MLSFCISYWDLIKFPYFADSIERGGIGGEREGHFTNNLKTHHFKCVDNPWLKSNNWWNRLEERQHRNALEFYEFYLGQFQLSDTDPDQVIKVVLWVLNCGSPKSKRPNSLINVVRLSEFYREPSVLVFKLFQKQRTYTSNPLKNPNQRTIGSIHF
jgi:hypothetical protein